MLDPAADPRFVVEDWAPAPADAAVEARVALLERRLDPCTLCPRSCKVARRSGGRGICGEGDRAVVADAFPHFGEERCLVGRGGSGTVFFGRCNLRCVFCQNHAISQPPKGEEPGEALDAEALAALFLRVQGAGVENLNLVTPTHVSAVVARALLLARRAGLRLPVVWNTSGYEHVAVVRALEGLVDVWMPDFKFWTTASARRYLAAPDYPARARAAIAEMHRQVGPLRFGPDGVARRGVLLRHLVMPGLLDETRAILDWTARELSHDTWVNVMEQYRPEHKVGRLRRDGRPAFAEIDRRLDAGEVRDARALARAAGLWRLEGGEADWY